MNGVEVHHQDAASGKLVITLEAPSVEMSVEMLRSIRTVSGVLLAEPVYHYLDDGEGDLP